MKQAFLDMENSYGHKSCIFAGDTGGEDLILNLLMPQDFLISNGEYYLVTENHKNRETVFLPLLAKCENTLMFSIPAEMLCPPTVTFFVGAYARRSKEVLFMKESEMVYLFVDRKKEEKKGEEK